ncbi:MAG: transcription termination/antitermination protein NusG [Bdellovibrionales bacterium]
MDKKWYIVNVQTSCENIAKTAIEERVATKGMEELFGEILVPVENVVQLIKGKKQSRAKKFFPGYIFVQMVLTDETWHLVRDSSKVTGFVGSSNNTKPMAVPEEQVTRITDMESGAIKPMAKANFNVGESVTVVDGPFNNFNGTVEEINEEKGKVKVSVMILGRPTPVELDFVQVERG